MSRMDRRMRRDQEKRARKERARTSAFRRPNKVGDDLGGVIYRAEPHDPDHLDPADHIFIRIEEVHRISKAAEEAGYTAYVLSNDDKIVMEGMDSQVLVEGAWWSQDGQSVYLRLLLSSKGGTNAHNMLLQALPTDAGQVLRRDEDELRKHFEPGYAMEADIRQGRINNLLHAAMLDTDDEDGEMPYRLPAHVGVTDLLRIPKPKWEMSFSYDKVFRVCEEIVLGALMGTGDAEDTDSYFRSSLGWQSIRTLAKLQQAHVVSIPPQQVNVLPEWDSVEELFRYAEQIKLPFNPVYFDFEGPGRLRPAVREFDYKRQGEDEHRSMELTGALMYKANSGLVIEPVGYMCQSRDDDFHGYMAAGQVFLTAPPPEEGMRVVERPLADTGIQVPLWQVGLQYATEATRTLGESETEGNIAIRIAKDIGGDMESVPGFAMPAIRDRGEFVDDIRDRGEFVDDVACVASVMMFIAAARALAVMFLLETPDVEIVEAGDRHTRKRAEREQTKIAHTVWIPAKRKQYVGGVPTGNQANYSHRFEVRGHYKHFPVDTQAARKRPDLVKECPRCGHCRRVWCPPFIKGDESLLFVPKTRRFEKEEDNDPAAA